MKSLVEASHWRVSSRSPSHNNVVVRSNDAKGSADFLCDEDCQQVLVFLFAIRKHFSQCENLGTWLPVVHIHNSWTKDGPPGWIIFASCCFGTKPLTRHLGGGKSSGKKNGISIVLVLLQFTVENYDMMSCQWSRKNLRFLLSIASMVGDQATLWWILWNWLLTIKPCFIHVPTLTITIIFICTNLQWDPIPAHEFPIVSLHSFETKTWHCDSTRRCWLSLAFLDGFVSFSLVLRFSPSIPSVGGRN